MGRELQRDAGQKPQTILMMPILEGLDGEKKMSKSLGNYVGLNDAPGEMYGKLMGISDELMWRYFELLSFKSNTELKSLRADVESGSVTPNACQGFARQRIDHSVSRRRRCQTAHQKVRGTNSKPATSQMKCRR